MTQYELWWAELPEPAGRRPVLLLTRPGGYAYLTRILAAELSTTVRSIPQEVRLGAKEGLSEPSVANLDNLHAIARRRLVARIGRLGADRIAEVKRALGHALGWDELAYPDG